MSLGLAKICHPILIFWSDDYAKNSQINSDFHLLLSETGAFSLQNHGCFTQAHSLNFTYTYMS